MQEAEDVSPANEEEDSDPDRPPNLPAHFIRTPYPFTKHKEFSKPRPQPTLRKESRTVSGPPRMPYIHTNQLKAKQIFGLAPSASDQWSVKGKQVLGLVADGEEFNIRTRRGKIVARPAQKGEFAGGSIMYVRRAPSSRGTRKRVASTTNTGAVARKGNAIKSESFAESTLFLSLRHRAGEKGVSNKIERIVVPSSLATHKPTSSNGKKNDPAHAHGHHSPMLDFDDQLFAERLRAAYKKLAGSWLKRTFNARTIKYIHLNRVGVWSAADSTTSNSAVENSLDTFLMASRVSDTQDTQNPFTEQKLWDLYRNPSQGKARYACVLWARKVASCNDFPPSPLSSSPNRAKPSSTRDAEKEQAADLYDDSSHIFPNARLLTLQFIHSFSLLRIILALSVSVLLSVAAALLWIFLGQSARLDTRSRGERVGPGVLIAVLVLLVEMVVFAGWVVGSWWRVP
jgi:hypothetical protein